MSCFYQDAMCPCCERGELDLMEMQSEKLGLDMYYYQCNYCSASTEPKLPKERNDD